MQFNSLVFLTGVLTSLARADPVAEPQSPEQSISAAQALESYFSSLLTDPALQSLATVVTDSAALASISAWEYSISSQVFAHQTPASNFLDGLPTQARSFYSSVYAAETSILAQNGITPTLAPTSTTTSTSTSKGGGIWARETGVMKVGAIVGAAVGVILAL